MQKNVSVRTLQRCRLPALRRRASNSLMVAQLLLVLELLTFAVSSEYSTSRILLAAVGIPLPCKLVPLLCSLVAF